MGFSLPSSTWLLKLPNILNSEAVVVGSQSEIKDFCHENVQETFFSHCVEFAVTFFCFVVCLVALLHVKIELHIHRQKLQELIHQTQNLVKRKATRDEEADSVLTILQTDSEKSKGSL